MVNQSKINDPRFWRIWEASGAVGTMSSANKRSASKPIPYFESGLERLLKRTGINEAVRLFLPTPSLPIPSIGTEKYKGLYEPNGNLVYLPNQPKIVLFPQKPIYNALDAYPKN